MQKEYHAVRLPRRSCAQYLVMPYIQMADLHVNYWQRLLYPESKDALCKTTTGEEILMNAAKITGIILIVIGLAGFFTGGFSFTKDTTTAKIGPIELKVQEKESVNVPQWLSLGALALGAIVLVMGFRKP